MISYLSLCGQEQNTELRMAVIEIYTDGAVNFKVPGWGFVALLDDKVVKEMYGRVTGDKDLLSQRNVAGEMTAVIRAIAWALHAHKNLIHRFDRILIVHDYSGCSAWPDGKWNAKNTYTQKYAQYVNKCRKKIPIKFKLIKGHGKNKNDRDNQWNDRADVLAKAGARKK